MSREDPPSLEEVNSWLYPKAEPEPEPEAEVLPGDDINIDLVGAMEELLAGKCQIISLQGVPDEAGYSCLTHNEPCTLREYREGYCRVAKPDLVTREDILEEFYTAVREGDKHDPREPSDSSEA